MPESNPLSSRRQPLAREQELAALYARDDLLLDRIRDLASHGHRNPDRTRREIDRLEAERHLLWLKVEPLLPEPPPPPLLTSEPAREPDSRELRAYNRRLEIIGHPPPWTRDELRLANRAYAQAKRERESALRAAMLDRARRLLAGTEIAPASTGGDRRQTVLAAWSGRRKTRLSRCEIREVTGLSKSVVQRAVARMLREGILSTNGDRKLRLAPSP